MFICDISVFNKFGKQKLDEMLIPFDIDWRTLVVILVSEQVQGISQAELIPFLQTDKGNVSRILDAMEKRGWILRQTDLQDHRNKLCYLTSQSKKIVGNLKAILEKWEEECFEGLTKDQIVLYKEVNKVLTKNLVREWK